MQNCYTVGHDSCTPGIIATLTSTADAVIVGNGRLGRLVFLSQENPPAIENGKILVAFRSQIRREGIPIFGLADSPDPADVPTVTVMVDTARSTQYDEKVRQIWPLKGSPHILTGGEVSVSGFRATQGLYALVPGDVLCMRPLGISSSDWAHQRVIVCEQGESGPFINLLSHAQYHKAHAKEDAVAAAENKEEEFISV